MCQRAKKALALVPVLMLMMGFARAAKADQVLQVPLETLLNARAVTTLTGGRLVPWTVGVDGGGLADGYMTAAASRFNNDPPTLKALPDDGRFPADARHPEVILHVSNDADPASQQTHYVRGAGTFSFEVAPATYSRMFLFFTSAEGSSALVVRMMYADATDALNVTVPDYFNDPPPNDPVIFNLAADLPKWTQQNVVAEMNHHNLTGVEIHPAAGKVLNSIQVDKTAAGYLVFWGATGIATGGDLDGGGDGAVASPDGATPRDGSVAIEAGGNGGTSSGGAAAGAGGANGVSDQGGSQAQPDAGCACEIRTRRSTKWSAWGLLLLAGTAARWRRARPLTSRTTARGGSTSMARMREGR